MPKPKPLSRLKLKPTRRHERRRPPGRKQSAMDSLYRTPAPQAHLARLPPLHLQWPAKISRKRGFRLGCRLVDRRIQHLCRATHVGRVYVTNASLLILTRSLALREVAEYLAGQLNTLDPETITLSQHFPRFVQNDEVMTMSRLYSTLL